MIGGLIIPIAKAASIKPNPDNRMSGPERLALVAFKQMQFCKVKGGRTCWIYHRNRLMPLSNVDRTTLFNPDNFSFMLGDEELVHSATTPPSQPHLSTSSSSEPSSS